MKDYWASSALLDRRCSAPSVSSYLRRGHIHQKGVLRSVLWQITHLKSLLAGMIMTIWILMLLCTHLPQRDFFPIISFYSVKLSDLFRDKYSMNMNFLLKEIHIFQSFDPYFRSIFSCLCSMKHNWKLSI